MPNLRSGIARMPAAAPPDDGEPLGLPVRLATQRQAVHSLRASVPIRPCVVARIETPATPGSWCSTYVRTRSVSAKTLCAPPRAGPQARARRRQ